MRREPRGPTGDPPGRVPARQARWGQLSLPPGPIHGPVKRSSPYGHVYGSDYRYVWCTPCTTHSILTRRGVLSCPALPPPAVVIASPAHEPRRQARARRRGRHPGGRAVLAGPSAFAADKSVSKAGAADAIPDASGGLDPAEQKIKDNLDARAQNESLGTTFSGVVLDADSDKVIWGHDADTALMPASNTKLATAITALTTLGGDHTFSTKVVYGDGTLTLVGGGDRT
ncbi:D-alanyl-D-alanine carboxypeptidase [Streptomyces sp. M19]